MALAAAGKGIRGQIGLPGHLGATTLAPCRVRNACNMSIAPHCVSHAGRTTQPYRGRKPSLNKRNEPTKTGSENPLSRKVREFREVTPTCLPRLVDTRLDGGEGGIRTHGALASTPVFETGTFNHSATSPWPCSTARLPVLAPAAYRLNLPRLAHSEES
jgi:hypothetical protein